MKKLLPVILAIFGLAAGTGAGMFLKPATVTEAGVTEAGATEANSTPPSESAKTESKNPVRRSESSQSANSAEFEYVKLNNQFVVPVVSSARVSSLVVVSLSIEVVSGQKELVFAREPKLRDAFLQVLFDHANSGGFDGIFTSEEKMRDLRGSLFEAAANILGVVATDVLVTDIVRQDV